MKTTMLVFITKDELRAFDVEKDKAVSCKGNPFLSYKNDEGINAFDKFIKDEYNLESYLDYTMDFFIVNLSADKKNVLFLANKFAEANSVSIIQDNYIIPLVYTLKEKVKKNTKQVVSIFNENYVLMCDENGSIFIECTDEKLAEKRLDVEDFYSFLNLNENKFGISEEAIKNIQNLIQNISLREKENENLNLKISDLEKNY